MKKYTLIIIPNKDSTIATYANMKKASAHTRALLDITEKGYYTSNFRFKFFAKKIFTHLKPYYKKGNFDAYLIDRNGYMLEAFIGGI